MSDKLFETVADRDVVQIVDDLSLEVESVSVLQGEIERPPPHHLNIIPIRASVLVSSMLFSLLYFLPIFIEMESVRVRPAPVRALQVTSQVPL